MDRGGRIVGVAEEDQSRADGGLKHPAEIECQVVIHGDGAHRGAGRLGHGGRGFKRGLRGHERTTRPGEGLHGGGEHLGGSARRHDAVRSHAVESGQVLDEGSDLPRIAGGLAECRTDRVERSRGHPHRVLIAVEADRPRAARQSGEARLQPARGDPPATHADGTAGTNQSEEGTSRQRHGVFP